MGDQIQAALGAMLRDGVVKDPRLASGLVTVTAVEMSPDLKQAKVYVSVFGNRGPTAVAGRNALIGDEVEAEDAASTVLEGLRSAVGVFKRGIADRLQLRFTPNLLFFEDASIAYGSRMESIIRDVRADDEALDDSKGGKSS